MHVLFLQCAVRQHTDLQAAQPKSRCVLSVSWAITTHLNVRGRSSRGEGRQLKFNTPFGIKCTKIPSYTTKDRFIILTEIASNPSTVPPITTASIIIFSQNFPQGQMYAKGAIKREWYSWFPVKSVDNGSFLQLLKSNMIKMAVFLTPCWKTHLRY